VKKILLAAAFASVIPAYLMLEAAGTYQLTARAEDDCPYYIGAAKLVSVERRDTIGVVCTYKTPSAQWL
jgi:hypothetical protein